MRAAKRLPAPEHYIETPASPMPRMCPAHRGDPGGMARDGQPVVNGRADLAALDGRFARTMMTRDEKDEAVSGILGALEGEVDFSPCAVETVPVEIDDSVGVERARPELSIPRPVKRRSGS